MSEQSNIGGAILTGIMAFPVFLIIVGIFVAISSLFPSCESTQTTPQNTVQQVEQDTSVWDSPEWMNDDDPISWRKVEEKLENQSGFKNAKYSCIRCGMKSEYPLNDGINGSNGVCAYCIIYLERKKRRK